MYEHPVATHYNNHCLNSLLLFSVNIYFAFDFLFAISGLLVNVIVEV